MTRIFSHLGHAVTRFRRDHRGSTAIEAAFIVPIFFAMIFSVFEVGHVFYKEANVEQAMSEAAREVKVGRAFTSDFVDPDVDQAACPFGTVVGGVPCPCATGKQCFFLSVCERVEPFLNGPCQEQLAVEVKRYATFADVPESAYDGDCPSDPGYVFADQTYDPGKPNDIVLLRSCFLMQTFSPALGAIDADTEGDGTRRIVSVQLHRNEPYDPDEDDD